MIILSQAFDSRLKMLNLFYALLFFFSGHYFVFRVLYTNNNTAATIWGIFAAVLMYLASYRFFNRAVLLEKLHINNGEVRWVEKTLFKSKSISFDVKEISNFRFIEKKTVAPHPLAGQSMDYLGFQTQEIMISQLAGDNQLAFDYEGQTITFGADLYSYEFDEIKSVLDKEAGF